MLARFVVKSHIASHPNNLAATAAAAAQEGGDKKTEGELNGET